MAITEISSPPVDAAVPVDRDWLTVAACAVCFLLSVGTLLIYIFGVFVRPLAADFHWTRTQVATALITGQFIWSIAATIPRKPRALPVSLESPLSRVVAALDGCSIASTPRACSP